MFFVVHRHDDSKYPFAVYEAVTADQAVCRASACENPDMARARIAFGPTGSRIEADRRCDELNDYD